MRVPAGEKGTALLTVLLLVAVMATVAATALDRISVGTRLAANVATVGQARSWLEMAELLAATRIEDMLAADQQQTTLAGGWMGEERTIALPGGASVRVRVEDGGNCFNLNSLVEEKADKTLVPRPIAQAQFKALMTLVGLSESEANRIADSASDYIDSDSAPLPSGAEDSSEGAFAANRLMADASELRSLEAVSGSQYRILQPWVCALPTTDLSSVNVNTLSLEQAPLLAMLAPGRLEVERARAQIAARPAAGYGSVLKFWQSPLLEGIEPASEASSQVKVRTAFFTLRAQVQANGVEVGETALIDARTAPAQIVRRTYGEGP